MTQISCIQTDLQHGLPELLMVVLGSHLHSQHQHQLFIRINSTSVGTKNNITLVVSMIITEDRSVCFFTANRQDNTSVQSIWMSLLCSVTELMISLALPSDGDHRVSGDVFVGLVWHTLAIWLFFQHQQRLP